MSELPAAESQRSRIASPNDQEDAAAFCARPACRKEYRRLAQPGRPQEYCSELCRRKAEKELRRLRSRLRHFEDVVAQTKIDLAAHGRHESPEIHVAARAASALERTEGVLRFVGNSNDAVADELRLLYEAMRPLISSERTRSPS